jgi:hypothetical protein
VKVTNSNVVEGEAGMNYDQHFGEEDAERQSICPHGDRGNKRKAPWFTVKHYAQYPALLLK